jgi:hypothetical protein
MVSDDMPSDMCLVGVRSEGTGKDEGRPVKHRITWTPNADGSVRQLWESSGPNGQWVVVFDGLYRRKP